MKIEDIREVSVTIFGERRSFRVSSKDSEKTLINKIYRNCFKKRFSRHEIILQGMFSMEKELEKVIASLFAQFRQK